MTIHLEAGVIVAERFKLERQLGQGGMGSVWLAHHVQLETPCALKFIEGENSNSEELRNRFAREAKAAAQLRSPHVVQILDHGVWDDTPYIAMELLEGEDLGQRLEREKRINPAEAVGILQQVARALSKAHAAGIVHRDLKPDNVYITRDEDREVVKILDFGIAKFGPNLVGLNSNTKTGSVLGTPYYMSPEQAQGAKDLDHRTDVWSLAVIAFECIVGQRPFDGEALGQVFVKIIASPLPVPSQLAPDLPPEFDQWWARAASRNLDERFPTARELVDALAMAFNIPTETTLTTSFRGSFSDITSSGRASMADPHSSPGSPRKNTFGQTATNPTVRAVDEPAAQPAQSSSKKPLIFGAIGIAALAVVGFVVATRGDSGPQPATGLPNSVIPTTTAAPDTSAKAALSATAAPAESAKPETSAAPTPAASASEKPSKPNAPGGGKAPVGGPHKPKKPKDLGF